MKYNNLTKIHDFDAAWKSILEAFEKELVEVLFPEIYAKINWDLGTESLDKELLEIQKDIFDKKSSEKIISDKIIKVKLNNFEGKVYTVKGTQNNGKYITLKELKKVPKVELLTPYKFRKGLVVS